MRERKLQIRSFVDERGRLSVAELSHDVPFEVKRVFWITQTTEQPRGGHAHRTTTELLFALHGSFTLRLLTAEGEEAHRLQSPSEGVFIYPNEWCDLCDFSDDCVVLVLADETYRPEGYINTKADLRR